MTHVKKHGKALWTCCVLACTQEDNQETTGTRSRDR